MDPNSAEFRKTILELRARALAGNSNLDVQLNNALDPRYWRKLNPAMSIYGKEPVAIFENSAVDASILESALQTFSASGYFQMPAVLCKSAVEQMSTCFDVTRNAGWHPTFVFVYDEFWRAFRGPVVARLLRRVLGEDYRQLSYIWGHYVPAGSSGWRPHVDGATDSNKLTLWLALSEATLENGCMYVVRRNAETDAAEVRFEQAGAFSFADVRNLLQNAKALPATAGSFLGWGSDVVHWGSISSPLAPPRLSVSVEFATLGSNPPEEFPPMEAGSASPLPSFEKRLHFIGSAIKNYELLEAGLLPYMALAKQLVRVTSVENACPPA